MNLSPSSARARAARAEPSRPPLVQSRRRPYQVPRQARESAHALWVRQGISVADYLAVHGKGALAHAIQVQTELARGNGSPALHRLLETVSNAMANCLLSLPTQAEMRDFVRVIDRTLAPVLWGVATQKESRDMGWAPLLAASVGFDRAVRPADTLLVSGLLPYRSDPSVLVPMTKSLMKQAPATAPLLLGLLGHHLRTDFRRRTDNVDLKMLAIALPHALRARLHSQGAHRIQLANAIVCGLTFDLQDAVGEDTEDDYLAHFVSWMELARDGGIEHPERTIRECFSISPQLTRTAPHLALHASRDRRALLGHGFLQLLTQSRTAPRGTDGEGVWGLLSGHPRWNHYLARTPIDAAAKTQYRFLQEVTEPGPLQPHELQTARAALQALQRRIPRCMHPPLFERTAQALATGDARAASHLNWQAFLEPPGTEDYRELRRGKWTHPFRTLGQTVSTHLLSECLR